jgi:hypothetical protein
MMIIRLGEIYRNLKDPLIFPFFSLLHLPSTAYDKEVPVNYESETGSSRG